MANKKLNIFADIQKITMLFFLLLILPSVFSDNCSHHYDGMYYTKTAIFTIKGLPTNLAFNPLNKDLHFTLIDVESLQNDDIQTRMDQYILRNNEAIKIDNINGQAAAVDVKTGKVYVASDDGLYFLNSSDKAQFFSNKDHDIVQLFKPNMSDVLYAVMFPENEVYILDIENNEIGKVQNIPCAYMLAVDDEGNIYYECDSKYIKMLLKGFQEPIEFVGIAKDSSRAVVLDSYGRVILATNDGIYMLRSNSVIPAKLMDLDYVPSGIVFDGDNFYIATNDIIYKYSSDDC